MKTRVLSDAQLRCLKEHKYSSTGSTLLDKYMQIYWEWVVSKLPLWLAPNAMTLIGLVVVILATSILIYLSPDGKQDLPAWSMFISALSLFIYQTLDACDGKQARRTQSQSQLGELFDHGCDSLSTIFISLMVAIMCQLGTNPPLLFFQCSFAIFLFYAAHWQTYVSGTLRFGKFDVTEVQFSIIFMLLVTALFGSQVWSMHLLNIVYMSTVPVMGATVGGMWALCDYFKVIFTGGVGKNGSTVAGTSVLSPSIPLLLVITPAFIIWQKSPSGVYENHPCLYLLCIGLIATKITVKLIVCHMSRSELAYLDSSMIGLLMLFLNQYFDCRIDETIVLCLAFLYSIYDLINYSISLCREISDYLNIYTFRISRPRDHHTATTTSSKTRRHSSRRQY